MKMRFISSGQHVELYIASLHAVALRVRKLTPSGFASCSTWGDPKTAHGVRTCSTWGDPKTAVAPLLGETPRPHPNTQLLYLGRPQDRTGSPFLQK